MRWKRKTILVNHTSGEVKMEVTFILHSLSW
jgi:hypothetical protein